MKIWDVFMIRDELPMLEARLGELAETVAGHILVEAPVDHRGNPKPLYFAENADRFAPWKDRITHVVADGLDPSLAPWPREHAQRDAAIPALEELAGPDDVVLIADVDEFPPSGFGWGAVNPAVSFAQRLAMYSVDWLYPELHLCTVAARWRWLRGKSLAAVRDNRGFYPVHEGGWHLTWLGGEEGQRRKLAVTCHEEMTDLSRDLLASGRCYREGIHHSGDFPMVAADVDETWPRFVWERRCPSDWFRPR